MVEEQVLLQFPKSLAAYMQQVVDSRSEEFQLTFNTNRNATFSCSKGKFKATLVDLPCIVETQRTYDTITFYKSCDIHQMMVVHDRKEDHIENPAKYESGITPPTALIRPKRFDRSRNLPPDTPEQMEEADNRLQRVGRDPVERYELLEIEVEETDEDEEDDEKFADIDIGAGDASVEDFATAAVSRYVYHLSVLDVQGSLLLSDEAVFTVSFWLLLLGIPRLIYHFLKLLRHSQVTGVHS